MKRTGLLLASVAVASVTACSAHSTAAPPATASAQAIAPLPPGCAVALATLPSSAPGTAEEAGADFRALGGGKGTTAASMADAVAADSSSIALDLSTGQPVTADVSKWTADAAALRTFCA